MGDTNHDLSTMLTSSQRTELISLVASIVDSMRHSLQQIFDPKAGLDKALIPSNNMSNDEQLLAIDPSKASVEEYDKQRELLKKYEEHLASSKMKTLKAKSFEAFHEWSQRVILRVGEVVTSKEDAKMQMQDTTKTTEEDSKNKHGVQVANLITTTQVLKLGRIVETPESASRLKFREMYLPTATGLTKLSMDQRTLILHSVLLLMLSLENYSAHSRVLLLLLCSSLKLPLKTFEKDESATAKGLLEGVKEMTADAETRKQVESSKDSKKWKIGIATVAGAALIGVTGGLAAPLVAAGVGSVMGGLGLGATSAAAYLGSVAGSTYLVGGLFGAYGGRMTGQMMENYAQEVEDFEFLPIHGNSKTGEDVEARVEEAKHYDHKLKVTVVISGWLTKKEEVITPWRIIGDGAEAFALKYALEAMLNLGNAMNGFVTSAAWGYAQKQIIAQTIFADLAAAMWPIGLLKAARVIDNPFNIAKNRSEKAGKLLADALINKAQGERPVTLIGYSLGARVIYSCLLSLADRNAFGLIENAILIGAPAPSDTNDWRILRAVVSGRLVNVFSSNDYVLGFMYRTSSLQYGVAGLQAVKDVPNVENVDVSKDATGHLRYRYLIGSILSRIGIEDVNLTAVEEEKKALQKMMDEEQRNSLDAQRKRLLRRDSAGNKEDEVAEADHEANEIEEDVRQRTNQSMMSKTFPYLSIPRLLNRNQPNSRSQNV